MEVVCSPPGGDFARYVLFRLTCVNEITARQNWLHRQGSEVHSSKHTSKERCTRIEGIKIDPLKWICNTCMPNNDLYAAPFVHWNRTTLSVTGASHSCKIVGERTRAANKLRRKWWRVAQQRSRQLREANVYSGTSSVRKVR